MSAAAVSIPRKRPIPPGFGNSVPALPKRSRRELAAGEAMNLAPPSRSRPKPVQVPRSPTLAPGGAVPRQTPLLTSRFFAPAAHSLPAQRPIGKPLVRSGVKPGSKPGTSTKPVTLPTKVATLGLKTTCKERETTYKGTEAQISERENLASSYTKRLLQGLADRMIKGEPGPTGIMSAMNAMGQPNNPYDHQRIAVKRMAITGQDFTVLGHDMGLGKTATSLQLVCAMLCVLKRVPLVVISVPSATLDQWEDAVADWLTIPKSKILVTSQEDKLAKGLAGKSILVVSRDCLALAFAKCHSKQEVMRETPRGLRKCVEWLRTPGTTIHPLFAVNPDVFIVDEAHVCAALESTPPPPLPRRMRPLTDLRGQWPNPNPNRNQYMRNPASRRCEAHHALACRSLKRVMLSGTFVVNSPTDLAGICKAGNAPRDAMSEGKAYDLQEVDTWVTQRCKKTINRYAVKLFQEKFLDRATDKILSLPPLEQVAVNYAVGLPYDVAAEYNAVLSEARSLKVRIESTQAGRATAKDLTQLMALLQHMQQYIISPVLAKHGALAFKNKATGSALLERASSQPTAAFHALHSELQSLDAAGHRRIVVAANHTTGMDIFKVWLERVHPEFGACFSYKGDMTQKERLKAKKGFLRSPRSILFLSIQAGGVGLHLVPGSEAMVFWGSMPFSPAHTKQAMKRIHRIGQAAPNTGKVTIVHMIPYGSVDAAIATVHADKNALINFVQEGDDSGFGSDTDSQWRKAGRIVDACEPVDEDGSFGEMPLHKCDENGDPIRSSVYTLLTGVVTRGRETPPAGKELEGMLDASDVLNDTLSRECVQRLALPTQLPSLGNLQAAGLLL
jgi:hypothetical protein